LARGDGQIMSGHFEDVLRVSTQKCTSE